MSNTCVAFRWFGIGQLTRLSHSSKASVNICRAILDRSFSVHGGNVSNFTTFRYFTHIKQIATAAEQKWSFPWWAAANQVELAPTLLQGQ